MSVSKKKTRVIKLVEDHETTWEEALKEYLLWKKAEGRSERTLKDYGFHVKIFFTRFTGNPLSDYELLERNIIEYMAEDVKPAYYNNKLVYLKTFFGWCVKKKYLSGNPLNDFKRRKADSRIVQIEPEFIKKLLSLPDQKTFPGLRDYSLILLQLDTGIRPKEALSLLVTDINFNSLEVYVRAENAKTRIARTLPISLITAKAIQKLIVAQRGFCFWLYYSNSEIS
ncbi:tyrosine-type recombinase/integrase [Desulfoscipio gibsoniae]|uniref:Site-specific recombinase XerD n=1 Tax=Desulfoscipio gibsoniae DSM 7213 TaxID=767817 RepID=R4KSI6_9FIRM|nr:tyrosine-type recombinase/integrase [Desulfoscipio gibsoniae]AGL03530.1 site-specific recombinase XerD [Desulfoscipio gibsoniae DSM 7213]